MKKLFKKYGATVLFYGFVFAMFVLGFVIGAYGRSAPNAEVADFYGDRVTSETTSIATVETVSKETYADTEAEHYTEIEVVATAYCACNECCGKTDGITATGTTATAGRTIAVDPNFIPYGTLLIIDGNTYIAEDCGGAVKGGDRIDIYFDTHEEAVNFGRKTLTAYVVK